MMSANGMDLSRRRGLPKTAAAAPASALTASRFGVIGSDSSTAAGSSSEPSSRPDSPVASSASPASSSSRPASSSSQLPPSPASNSSRLASSSSQLPPLPASPVASSSGLRRSSSVATGLPLLRSPQQPRSRRGTAKGRGRSSSSSGRASAKAAVMEDMRESMKGETEGFIFAVLRTLKTDPRVTFQSGPSNELMAEIQEKVKIDLYGRALKAMMPGCFLACDSFVTEILKRVVGSHSSQELMEMLDAHMVDVYFMWHDALNTSIADSDKLSCPVCMEPFINVPREGGMVDVEGVVVQKPFTPTLRRTEHWSSNPCGHVICRSCMRQWAEAEVEQQRTRIKCPAIGCSHTLWDHDLQALLSEEIFSRYKELKSVDHLKKLKDDLNDPVLGAWLRQNARPCPDCHIIVSRSAGCNSMKCVCGTGFCYRCGFKQCACGRQRRGDIWNPEAS